MNLNLLPLIFGFLFTIYGSVQILWGLYYADISKRESTAVGTIHYVGEGMRRTRYEYSFRLGSKLFEDEDEVCETAPARGECKVGTAVLVYYDSSNPAKNMLQEYGAESRRNLHTARWMIPIGICLLLLMYFRARIEGNTGPDDESDELSNGDEFDVPHVVPGEKT